MDARPQTVLADAFEIVHPNGGILELFRERDEATGAFVVSGVRKDIGFTVRPLPERVTGVLWANFSFSRYLAVFGSIFSSSKKRHSVISGGVWTDAFGPIDGFAEVSHSVVALRFYGQNGEASGLAPEVLHVTHLS